MQYSAQSFFDAAFLIPLGLTPESPFPRKFLLFMNSRAQCVAAGKFLRARLPPELRNRVVWVHSDMSREFCVQALEDLRAGRIFGIVCTDVVGMGIDIPDIELIVQFQLPNRFCTLFQRFGRCVRSIALLGFAILIVESKYFDNTKKRLQEQAAKRQERQAAKKRKADESLDNSSAKSSLDVKTELLATSLVSEAGSNNVTEPSKTRHKRVRSVEEVMDAFINAHQRPTSASQPGCRRTASNLFFDNPAVPQEGSDDYCCTRCCRPPPPASECCDICNPGIAKSVMTVADLPPISKRTLNQFQLRKEDPAQWSTTDQGLREALEIWRDDEATARWGPNHMIGGRGILGNEQIERIVPLARRGLVQTVENLKRHVPKWHYHDRYGPKIVNIILSVYPAHQDAPKSQQTAAPAEVELAHLADPPPSKKPRAQQGMF
ncbi:Helicase conserved C-terminal domain [Ceratobasidium sp. AG-Ba]|nr:Helicase conserved C-terminal domain [Ceratobasidium sp. AG-Ba]